MRWMTVTGLALAFAIMAGCKQPCYLTQDDCEHYHALGLPPNLEKGAAAAVLPTGADGPSPATVTHPERTVRYLSLAEAIALALEQGTVGSPLLNGTTSDSLLSFQGRGVVSPENPIRVLALERAVAGTDIEASLSKFDARWVSSLSWSRIDRPVATALDTFQAGPFDTIRNDDGTLSTSLLKPLPTGGVAGITFRNDYELTNLPARLNPSYRPSVQFQFEQPLLQGFGVEINQLRAEHPGSLLTPFNPGGRVDGILITRLRFDQHRAEFERQVHTLLGNVEVAYWNLYGAYWALYSREQGLRLAFQAWRMLRIRFDFGKATVQDLEKIRGQYELFRSQRFEALGHVLESEHQLRGLVGLPVEDGSRLVPVDEPTLAPYQPDWCAAVNDALTLRPELVLARQDLTARQFDLLKEKNLLLPDLRFLSTYDVNGAGGGADSALRGLAGNDFHDWQVGLRLEVPVGFREAHAGVRAGRLRLAQSYLTLRDQENKARRYVEEQYRAVIQSYTQIQAQRAQREAYAGELKARFQDFSVHGAEANFPGMVNVLLEAQRFWADALRGEYAAAVEYNNALARFEYATGTIMQRDNVVISEGPLPHCAQVRAVEHESGRRAAVVLRERAKPVPQPPCDTGPGAGPALPELPETTAPSLPSLFEGQQPLPEGVELVPAGARVVQAAGGAAVPRPVPRRLERLPAPGPLFDVPTAGMEATAVSLGRPTPGPSAPVEQPPVYVWRPAVSPVEPGPAGGAPSTQGEEAHNQGSILGPPLAN